MTKLACIYARMARGSSEACASTRHEIFYFKKIEEIRDYFSRVFSVIKEESKVSSGKL